MSPAPQGGRKVRGAQMKKDGYNHVLTKYKQLTSFLNPKSEKEDSMSPAPLPQGRGRKVRGEQTKKR